MKTINCKFVARVLFGHADLNFWIYSTLIFDDHEQPTIPATANNALETEELKKLPTIS